MKRIFVKFILLSVLSLAIIACKKDDEKPKEEQTNNNDDSKKDDNNSNNDNTNASLIIGTWTANDSESETCDFGGYYVFNSEGKNILRCREGAGATTFNEFETTYSVSENGTTVSITNSFTEVVENWNITTLNETTLVLTKTDDNSIVLSYTRHTEETVTE